MSNFLDPSLIIEQIICIELSKMVTINFIYGISYYMCVCVCMCICIYIATHESKHISRPYSNNTWLDSQIVSIILREV